MDGLLHELLLLDRALAQDVTALRLDALTPLFVALSAWWARGLLVLAALVVDTAARRPVPVVTLVVGASMLVASWLVDVLKGAVGRERPPEVGLGVDALVALPATASFPSGHAATAFAAAAALALLVPRWRVPALVLAALVAVSRVYLGVHFWLDVLAGAVVGIAVGLALAGVARQSKRIARRAPAVPRATSTTEA